ncbi:tryptophan synthase subunit alpha [Fulvivirgaceae bacterium BMA10]|uniref:Tryptophan synthase alpha chain n=1 Tax=Splendidivirga corallicola TaxID=3051826 RepID=A0ABT8KGI2_9BACT|nr:tryptophan synthase subunit alpha [Fulvivirgaceae bacterium BMA10]
MNTIIEKSNRLDKVFEEKKDHVLSVYFSAGFPGLNDTAVILEYLQEAGADIIEIGIPFSDPIADGPTIQQSNQQSLDNGMSLKLLFSQLQGIRSKIDTPIILMGYVNPVLQYGIEDFCKDCQKVGVDGLILPDLPMQEYMEEYKTLFDQYGLYNIFLITPQTSEQRIKEIDANTNGFIYMVSSASTTGAKSGIATEQIEYFERVKTMQLKNPTMIGFGISNHETFAKACDYASGAIIGSAFIKLLSESTDLKTDINKFIKSIRNND